MSPREVLLILAHAQMCERCQERLMNDPNSVFRGRAVTDEEKALLNGLTSADFLSAERLAEASGYDVCELIQYYDHPVARMRHF
jgi:hypothetical protein